MKIKEMTAAQAWEYFHDLGQRGFLATDGEQILGWIGFNSDDRGLYVHSMFCTDEGHTCAALAQAVINLARNLDIDTMRFVVDADNPHFLRLVESGRATVQSYIVKLPISNPQEKHNAKSIS